MKISYVVAMGPKGEIGLNNKLLWHIPEDLKNFKKITTNKMVVMGRKTFESIGKALPDRENIVITHQENFSAPGVQVFHDPLMILDYALEKEEALAQENNDENFEYEVMVIGGGVIFEAFMPYVHKIYLSEVPYTGECDTYFPTLNKEEWNVESEEKFEAFHFKVLTRI